MPIATQMVHCTKTFEILGTAPVHQEAPAEIVEGFSTRSESIFPATQVRHGTLLEASQAVVEYGQPARRCGVRGARTRGHVHTGAPVVASTVSVDHDDNGANSFPYCGSADRHRHVIADGVRGASPPRTERSLVVKFQS